MCGIFGIIAKKQINVSNLHSLANHAKQRGKDSSGLVLKIGNHLEINRADFSIDKLLGKLGKINSKLVLGHSRLITNGLNDNQPVIRNKTFVLHNGIIVNDELLWDEIKLKRYQQIDTEIILALSENFLTSNSDFNLLPSYIFEKCKGQISCVLVLADIGKLILLSNNGSLYTGQLNDDFYFASESFSLKQVGCKKIKQIRNNYLIVDIDPIIEDFKVQDFETRTENLIPSFKHIITEEKLLEYNQPVLKRCKKCILPETMPFINFDSDGVCNYCNSYKLRNVPKPKEILFDLVKPYRKSSDELDCIVPFSGGRDSCYALHLIVNELKMKPVTYTYDWGMVTDLGRRNISRMCAELGVENIIVAADISQKRHNIAMNLKAWLKSPHLGMMAMLTAGDKHFFRYVETIKKQTGLELNLWGINPLEVTHFKTGFLNIKPDFEEDKVYSNGIVNQLNYHKKRFGAMLESPGYFNSSLFDTLSGEYYRSFHKKKDYYHIFDYWKWDEHEVNNSLINSYGWETAIDTNTTWRIGDGTAAFYNYVYHIVAGFTEHDTFRSNQIREGQLSREEALKLVEDENRPRYENIRWYLDTLNFNFIDTIKIVNGIQKIYK
jgi:glucosamine--fructose-6-phosphate aminotransferase (isomerizing)